MQEEGSAAAAATAEVTNGPPARPGKESALPSPLLGFEQPRPRLITLSTTIWFLSCLTGLAAVGYFLSRLDGVHDLLETTMREEDPAINDRSLELAITATIGICLGLIGLAIALKLWLAVLMAARRNWARILLAIVGVLALPLTAVSATLLTVGGVEQRAWLLAAIITQEALVMIGIITMFMPGPNAWFRLRLRR